MTSGESESESEWSSNKTLDQERVERGATWESLGKSIGTPEEQAQKRLGELRAGQQQREKQPTSLDPRRAFGAKR